MYQNYFFVRRMIDGGLLIFSVFNLWLRRILGV